MELDLSPLEPFANGLLQQLLIVIGIPLVAILVLKYILIKLRIPNNIASFISSLAFLYLVYKMFMVVAG